MPTSDNAHVDRRLLVRVMVPYLGILIVVLTSGLVAHWIALRLIEQETTRINASRIEWSAEILASRLDEIRGLIDQLEIDPLVQRFQKIEEPFVGANTYQVLVTIRGLADHRLWNSSLIDYFLVFHRSRHVLAPGIAYSFSDFAGQVLAFTDDEAGSWLRRIREQHHFATVLPVRPITHFETQRPAALFVRSLGSPGFSTVTAVAAIDARLFDAILDRARDGADGWAYILDANGEMISYRTADGRAPTVTGFDFDSPVQFSRTERTFITQAVVQRFGWKIVAGQPYRRVMAEVTRVRNLVLALTAAMALCGVVAALLFAYRTAGPMRLLMSLFADPAGVGDADLADPYQYITDHVRRLIHDRDELQAAVAGQEPIVRAAFAEQLLSGRIHSRDDCVVIARRLGIGGERMIMVTAAIAVADRTQVLTEQSLRGFVELRSVLRRALASIFANDPFVFDVDETTMAMVISFAQNDTRDLRQTIETTVTKIVAALPERWQSVTRFAFGSFSTDVFGLSDSYSRAKALLLSDTHSRTILWTDDHPPTTRSMYYPTQIEQQLKNAVQTARVETAESLIRAVYNENTEVRRLDGSMLGILCAGIAATVVRALDEINCADGAVRGWIDEVHVRATAGGLPFGVCDLVQLVKLACDETRNRVPDHGCRLIEQALDVIARNLSEKNLSLQSVARELSLSEVHLSRLFSAHVGRTFREYVEEARMARAESMLVSTDLPIKEIASALGYNSLNSFSRAFHRRHACTASSFRA